MTERELAFPSFSFIADVAGGFGAAPARPAAQYPDEIMRAVLCAAVSVPFAQMQLFDPRLVPFTRAQIADMLGQMLAGKAKVKADFGDIKSQRKVPFSPEEQMAILTFIRVFPDSASADVILHFGDILKPCRSLLEIAEKVEEMRRLTEEQKDEIISGVAHSICEDELFGISTQAEVTPELARAQLSPSDFLQCRCSCMPQEDAAVDEKALEGEILPLMAISPHLWSQEMRDTELAILRSDKMKWYMRREAILVGRGSIDFDVDVDLSTFGEKACVHISRHQAVIAFLKDYNFYINNIGNRVFRVNGQPIYPGKCARLIDNAILDFSGILMLFYSNHELIRDLREAVDLGLVNTPDESTHV